MIVLVDSSIWIPFLRGKAELPGDLPRRLAEGEARVCPVIWVELYAGIKGKREEGLVAQIADLCPSLEMDQEVWKEASLRGRKAQRAGLNCPLADVLIVACALRHGVELEHADKHMAALLEL